MEANTAMDGGSGGSVSTESPATTEGQSEGSTGSERLGNYGNVVNKYFDDPESFVKQWTGENEGEGTESDQSQEAGAQEKSNEIQDLTPEEIAKKLGEDEQKSKEAQEEKESSHEEFLEILYNGLPQKLSREQTIEFAQKGYDYTQKTQELALERKNFQEERQEVERVLEEQAQQYKEEYDLKQKWDFFFTTLQKSDPDLYQEISEKFSETTATFDNPIIKAQLDQVRAAQEEILRKQTEQENASIRNEWIRGQGEIESGQYGKALQSLGMSPDWEKVKNHWMDNAKATVEQAFLAVHGDEMTKRYASRAKVQKTVAKVEGNNSPTTGGMKPAGEAPLPKRLKRDGLRGNKWEAIAEMVNGSPGYFGESS